MCFNLQQCLKCMYNFQFQRGTISIVAWIDNVIYGFGWAVFFKKWKKLLPTPNLCEWRLSCPPFLSCPITSVTNLWTREYRVIDSCSDIQCPMDVFFMLRIKYSKKYLLLWPYIIWILIWWTIFLQKQHTISVSTWNLQDVFFLIIDINSAI